MTDTKSLIAAAESGDAEARNQLVDRVFSDLHRMLTEARRLPRDKITSLLLSELGHYLEEDQPRLGDAETIKEVKSRFKRKVYDRFVDRLRKASAKTHGGHGRNSPEAGTRIERLGDRDLEEFSEEQLMIELSDTIRVVREELDDELRSVLDCLYDESEATVNQISYEEIGEILGISRNAARRRMERLRKKLLPRL